MSRFNVGEEITVRLSQGSVTRGKFYTVTHIDIYRNACILDDESDVCAISDDFGLTREEYERAEHAPEITLNGAVYILKPKPHEWKFGDWARHPAYGVVFVASKAQTINEVFFVLKNGDYEYCDKLELTYISTAEIPA